MSKGALKELMAAVGQLKGEQRKYLVHGEKGPYVYDKKFEGSRKRAFEVGYYRRSQ